MVRAHISHLAADVIVVVVVFVSANPVANAVVIIVCSCLLEVTAGND